MLGEVCKRCTSHVAKKGGLCGNCLLLDTYRPMTPAPTGTPEGQGKAKAGKR